MEWFSTAVVAVVSIAGMFFTWLTSKQSRDHAASLQREQLEQLRKAEAYVQVLEVVEQMGAWAQSVHPFITSAGDPGPVPMPDVSRQVASHARLLAFGSTEIAGLWDDWRKVIEDVLRADRLIRFGQDGAAKARVRLDRDLRTLEADARATLSSRVNEELTGTRSPD